MNLERQQVSSREIMSRSRAEEIALIEPLLQREDNEGVIGRIARHKLKRLPSSIYWQGLGIWGIRLFPASQEQYHRSLDSFYAVNSQTIRNDDGEPEIGRIQGNWHVGISLAPKGFPKNASFVLTPEEGEYLRERILSRAPGAASVLRRSWSCGMSGRLSLAPSTVQRIHQQNSRAARARA